MNLKFNTIHLIDSQIVNKISYLIQIKRSRGKRWRIQSFNLLLLDLLIFDLFNF